MRPLSISVPAAGLLGSAALAATLFVTAPSWAADPHGPVAAAEPVSPEIARRAASIARQTMSPFCPGRTLADCPSGYAAEWRDDIRTMLARGMTADEIQAELFARAGGDLSGSPNRGTSYVWSLVFGAGALGLLALVLYRLRRGAGRHLPNVASSAAEIPAGTPQPTAVDDQRLQAELDAEADDSDVDD